MSGQFLKLGQSVPLTTLDQALKSMKVTLAWDLLPDLKNPPEGDIFALLLDKNQKAPTNEDFIFYNQPDGVDDAAHLSAQEDGTDTRTGGVQSVVFALDTIRYDITSIIVGLNLYRGSERDQSFRYLEQLLLTLSDDATGVELASCSIPLINHRDTTCMIALTLARNSTSWDIVPTDEGYPNFEKIVTKHGIIVSGA